MLAVPYQQLCWSRVYLQTSLYHSLCFTRGPSFRREASRPGRSPESRDAPHTSVKLTCDSKFSEGKPPHCLRLEPCRLRTPLPRIVQHLSNCGRNGRVSASPSDGIGGQLPFMLTNHHHRPCTSCASYSRASRHRISHSDEAKQPIPSAQLKYP